MIQDKKNDGQSSYSIKHSGNYSPKTYLEFSDNFNNNKGNLAKISIYLIHLKCHTIAL